MTVTSERKYEQLKILIDGAIHLQLKLNDLVGFQSWIHGEKEYYIEYYFTGGAKITTAYGEKERWCQILEVLYKKL